jgi:integrase
VRWVPRGARTVRGPEEPSTTAPGHGSRSLEDLRWPSGGRERANLGVRVAGHDLRRSFGRIDYQNGVSRVDLRYIYGHESVDMTAHYVGLYITEAARGLSAFGEAMAAVISRVGA